MPNINCFFFKICTTFSLLQNSTNSSVFTAGVKARPAVFTLGNEGLILIVLIILISFVLIYFLAFVKKSPKVPNSSDLQLEKPLQRFFFSNRLMFLLVLLNFFVVTYFYMRKDIVFTPSTGFPILENVYGHNVFLILIVVRVLISFISSYCAEYLRNLSSGTKKKKKNALSALTLINIMTSLFSLPLLSSFYGYMKNSEILFHHGFLGTFRRFLSETERANFSEKTIQNFLEKMDCAKEIQTELKNWVLENTESILRTYDKGSDFATKNLLEKLELQKGLFEREAFEKKLLELEKIINNLLAREKAKDPQELGPGLFEKLNLLNPLATDPKNCLIAWGFLVGGIIATGFIVFAVSKQLQSHNIRDIGPIDRVNYRHLNGNHGNAPHPRAEINEIPYQIQIDRLDSRVSALTAIVEDERTRKFLKSLLIPADPFLKDLGYRIRINRILTPILDKYTSLDEDVKKILKKLIIDVCASNIFPFRNGF